VTAAELYLAIVEANGKLAVSADGSIEYECPRRLVPLVTELKPELVNYLRASAGLVEQVPIRVACRCVAKPYPHHHTRDEMRAAKRAWNEDSALSVKDSGDKLPPEWAQPYPHDPAPGILSHSKPDSSPVRPQSAAEVKAALPPGVRLVSFERRLPPVAVTRAAVVVNVPLFIGSTLQQLDAALNGDSWAAGNWSVRELTERLEQVGVTIEIKGREKP
jgi:hypothetical protein